jgi:hypothetical protein
VGVYITPERTRQVHLVRATVEDMVRYILTTGVAFLVVILVIVGRTAMRAFRDFIVNLWPH